ncbi:hypothetical protein MKEN_00610300 [Mycena kentingensis (nom. inval.)]|nr:hypothetical protein MKEN_00610300 [Mycena kentingensis (nom. inval.)]
MTAALHVAKQNRNLTLALVVTFIASTYWFCGAPHFPNLNLSWPPMSSTQELAGWYSRTTAHPDPDSFTPTREALTLLVLRSTPVEPEGFTLALFDSSPDKIAVDAMGRVRTVPESDYTGILALAQRVAAELPTPDTFRKTWRVQQMATSQPIERLFIPVPTATELVEVGVQGFKAGQEGALKLKSPVEEWEELPGGRGEGDAAMVGKVKGVVAGEIEF